MKRYNMKVAYRFETSHRAPVYVTRYEDADGKYVTYKDHAGSQSDILESLKALVKVFVEGRNYETTNPYCRPEIKAALKAIGKATDQDCGFLDVKI